MLSDVRGLIYQDCDIFQLKERAQSRWNGHRQPRAEEVEYLYGFNRAAESIDSARRNPAYVDR